MTALFQLNTGSGFTCQNSSRYLIDARSMCACVFSSLALYSSVMHFHDGIQAFKIKGTDHFRFYTTFFFFFLSFFFAFWSQWKIVGKPKWKKKKNKLCIVIRLGVYFYIFDVCGILFMVNIILAVLLPRHLFEETNPFYGRNTWWGYLMEWALALCK